MSGAELEAGAARCQHLQITHGRQYQCDRELGHDGPHGRGPLERDLVRQPTPPEPKAPTPKVPA